MVGLTYKEESFCQKYIELEGNASAAYRAVYDCKEAKAETITNNAYMMKQKSDIAARIEELEALALRRHQTTVDKVIAEYAKLAFLDVTQIFYPNGQMRPLDEIPPDARAAIAGIDIMELNTEEEHLSTQIKKIKLVDKKGALDSLAKVLEMFVTKIEHTGKDGAPLIPREKTKDELLKEAQERGLPIEIFDK